jgi:succinate dehydrogenase / fumarate reductase cytochrome b subunit
MATTVIQEGQPGSKARFADSFVLHKLMSLTGVIPIGLFMIFHLVVNSYALRGEAEFNTGAKAISYLPFVLVVELGAIFVPLIFHAVYGLFIVAESQSNTGTYQYGRNWLYSLQRWSGVVALVYILIHVISTTGVRWTYEATGGPMGHEYGYKAITYAAMAYRFANPLYLLLYVVGILAASFHLGNGLFNFGIRWGITIGKEAQRISAALWLLLGLGLAFIGIWTAVNYHLVGRNFQGRGDITQQYRSLDDLVKNYGPVPVEQNRGATPSGTTTAVPAPLP